MNWFLLALCLSSLCICAYCVYAYIVLSRVQKKLKKVWSDLDALECMLVDRAKEVDHGCRRYYCSQKRKKPIEYVN